MPADRHVRRGNRFLPSPFSTAKPTSAPTPAPEPDAPPASLIPSGYSTETTPSFLRRSKATARGDEILIRSREGARILQAIGDSTNIPGLRAAAAGCVVLLDTAQTVRQNRTQCMQLIERVNQVVRAIINVTGGAAQGGAGNAGPYSTSYPAITHASADSGSTIVGVDPSNGATSRKGAGGVQLSEQMVHSIEQFTGTLTKLHETLLEQASYGLFARILRHAETRDALAQCQRALDGALSVFGVQTDLVANTTMGMMRRDMSQRHQELVALLTPRPR